MERYVAYCSQCNASVVVQWDSESDEPLDPSKIECLEVVASCQAAGCPLTDASASELLDLLEFLPSGAEGGKPRGLEEAERIVSRARATSMRLQLPQDED